LYLELVDLTVYSLLIKIRIWLNCVCLKLMTVDRLCEVIEQV